MNIIPTAIPEVRIIEPDVFGDNQGLVHGNMVHPEI